MATKKKATEAVALVPDVEVIFPVALEGKAKKTVTALAKITVIESDADRALVEALIKDGKELSKEVETIRFSFTKPLDQKKAAVMELEKVISGPVNTQVTRLAGLVNGYIREQHRLAEAEKARLAEEEEKALKRLRSSSSIAKVQTEFEEKRAEVVSPTAGVRMDTKYEVVDLNQVPRELLMIDPDKVKKLLASGAEHCAGLRIWKEPSRSGR
jgi:hypothetical protein